MKIKYWILASRPKTLPAAIAPVMLGVALAFHDGISHWNTGLITLIAAMLIQIGTNLANDLFDFLNGTDTSERIGPARVTQSGLLSTTQVKNGMIITFSLALAAGTYLVYIGGWPIVWIGLASIAAGIAYTGGPYPLGYHGWGDIFVIVFFGLIAVPGTYYLQTGMISIESLLVGFSMGTFSTAILVVNNLRDVETDTKTGKRTLVVRWGKLFGRLEYSLMMVISYFIPAVLAVTWKNDLSMYLYLFSIPVAVKMTISVWTLEGRELYPILGGTARVMMVYSILFVLGLIL
ncbi:MAG: 1,4-dihydroxy-2-naphthoate polyprenyltransferase [Candidatus Marinimicrobia bacterium]|jgi:1,4-dihydroxy-2-naphthoate octaprenyltransferase|nr:1,4-dihydroxy-2-naphthoate polyprenyltransferase [Candidatus Neomarinimicrobiota bacterium]MBT3633177.1 1,4-dihydroxy-2-naphthoate polyprenyltransferase [Candidatus Neomarinimicrobiota bacterium]MBT3682222.1 1,4-dihydroxy-2-naphthoate polyprenyltransferase [Candidatus Neomarinimicrobiota bacterium]MBT3758777.1 1,4-dihydroxy-2-naphthoate polyprenyltransferase [Candidatus Neomarinimicrobiota bacterium]MBT3895349.1 1,4-dihydroxy-2-naphthoate polyprenyltransferase [Candidatus Neomarinimicrobiota